MKVKARLYNEDGGDLGEMELEIMEVIQGHELNPNLEIGDKLVIEKLIR